MSLSTGSKRLALGGCAVVAAAIVVAPVACGKPTLHAVSQRIENRSQLIGGIDALGDVGDLKLSNGKVQFIIQGIQSKKSNFSRGWGIYGGSLVDADLVRVVAPNSSAPVGHDHFGEMFPAYFLEAIAPDSVEVGNDGSDGKPATVVVTGYGAPFLSLARTLLNGAGLDDSSPESGLPSGSGMLFTNTYSLGPSDQFLTITTSLVQPNADLKISSVPLGPINVPFGNVVLFGNGNSTFMPGAGFDLYYALQDSYHLPARLPALPGVATDLIATRTPDGVSYGVAVPADPEVSYVAQNPTIPNGKADDMLVPFVAGSFTGVYSAQPPKVIPAGTVFSYKTYFMVGQGDVGSVRDIAYDIKGATTGKISARVREAETDKVVPDAMLIVLGPNCPQTPGGSPEGPDCKPFSEYDPNENGQVLGKLAPGNYEALIVVDNRERSATIPFTVKAGQTTFIAGNDGHTLTIPRNAILNVKINESKDSKDPGRPLPAKITVVGTSPANPANDNLEPQNFLFNLRLGDRTLPTDGIPDDHNDPNTRRYVQRVILTDANGRGSGEIPPGQYEIYASRGPEYAAVDMGPLTAVGGKVYEMGGILKRVVETPGYASADFHVHSINSIDGHIALDQRVNSYAAEGVEILTSTDHNIVTNYGPLVEAMKLKDFIHSTVGLEMTTLEMGHFNAFPLTYQPGSVTGGSFRWMNLPPKDLFAALRASPISLPTTIVQANHPRDSILGYFGEFNVNPETGGPADGNLLASPNGPAFGTSNFSWAYDAMEVFNGKRQDLLQTYRMPATRPANMPAGYWKVEEVGGKPGDVVRTPCKDIVAGCPYAAQSIAFPGSIEDWFKQLNSGGQKVAEMYPLTLPTSTETILPVTATGNSDSHQLYFEEAGTPRNWVKVPTDEPRNVTDDDIVKAIKEHAVVLSNGPYIEMTLTDPATSKTAQVGGLLATAAKTLKMHIRVQAAPWVTVNRLTIYSNASAGTSPSLPAPTVIPITTAVDKAVRYDDTVDVTVPVNAGGAPDAWFVVTVEGDGTEFPYVTPIEQPPLQISDAISTIAGPLGLGGDTLAGLRPAMVHIVTPFGMTNPIWVDTNSDGVAFGRPAPAGAQFERAAGYVPPSLPIPAVRVMPQITEEQATHRPSNLYRLFSNWGDGHHN